MYQIFWMELIKPFFNNFAKIWAFEIPQNYPAVTYAASQHQGRLFWIVCKWPAFLSSFSWLQLIQNSVPSVAGIRQCDIRIVSTNLYSCQPKLKITKNQVTEMISFGGSLKFAKTMYDGLLTKYLLYITVLNMIHLRYPPRFFDQVGPASNYVFFHYIM